MVKGAARINSNKGEKSPAALMDVFLFPGEAGPCGACLLGRAYGDVEKGGKWSAL